MKAEFENKNKKIENENEIIGKNFLKLKNKIFLFREEENKKLKILVCKSEITKKKLTKIKEYGEKILRQTELCRKLETEREKLGFDYDVKPGMPFYIQKMSKVKVDNLAID